MKESLFMKLMRSSFVTRPPLPVALTNERSTLFFFAKCLTAGVESTLEELSLPGPLVGCASSSEEDELLLLDEELSS